jgi:hypothetical protein
VEEIASGEDEFSAKAVKYLIDLGLKKRPWVVSHAEIKLAARLRERHLQTGHPQHATLVLNNQPCPGILGCTALLPVMLPAGCTLTVHGPNYRRTFTGGATL